MEEIQTNKSIDFSAVILQITIFARVSPNQKEHIIKIIKESGKSVLMCGDGTNDVGALKKSDVGIALVGLKDEPTPEEAKAEKERKEKLRKEAMMKRQTDILQMLNTEDDTEFKSGDACIAAPFTNKFSNSLKCGESRRKILILSVITIMRQGICTMTTTMQTYRILTLQSLIYAYTMSTLHMENLKTSDTQNTIMGVFGTYYFFQLSNSKVGLIYSNHPACQKAAEAQTRNHDFQLAFLDFRGRTSSHSADLDAALPPPLEKVQSR